MTQGDSRVRRWGGGARRALLLAVLVPALGCWGAGGARAQIEEPDTSRVPRRERLSIHWNDGADTTRVLRADRSRPLRLAVDITGADSLNGYTVRLRGLTRGGTAWTQKDTLDCAAFTWSAAAEADSTTPAPWAHKLSITDLQRLDDGSIWALVSTAFDQVALNPDSTYCLFHLDLVPPAAKSDSVACGGWDAGAQFYVESADLLFTPLRMAALSDLGSGVSFEPAGGGATAVPAPAADPARARSPRGSKPPR
jgi:hypothetical protein